MCLCVYIWIYYKFVSYLFRVQFTIRQMNLSDADNFMASSNIISFAQVVSLQHLIFTSFPAILNHTMTVSCSSITFFHFSLMSRSAAGTMPRWENLLTSRPLTPKY